MSLLRRVCHVRTLVFFVLLNILLAKNIGVYANQTPVLLDKPHEVYNLENYIEILEDKNGQYSYEEVISDSLNPRFKRNDEGVLNLGYSNSTYWIRFKAMNNLRENVAWLLEIPSPALNEITVFSIEKDKTNRGVSKVVKRVTGDHYPFSEREINHQFFLIPLEIEAFQISTFYVCVRSTNEEVNIPLKLVPMKTFSEQDSDRQLLLGIYYGLMIMVMVVNFFLFITVKDNAYFDYVIYIFTIAFLQLALNGLLAKFLAPNNPYIVNHAPLILASLTIATVMNFTKSFLNTKTLLPFFDKINNIIIIIGLIEFIFSFFEFSYHLTIMAINSTTFLAGILILVTSFKAYLKGFKPARFFLFAFFFLIAGSFIFILKNYGAIPSSFVTDNGIQIGSTLQVVLLSFALADRFKLMKEEQDRTQQEINTRLETIVKERTEIVTKQNELIEQKNKDITDSILYAKKIQETILPDKHYIDSIFPNSFIFYQPKDIVSGDFYWFTKTKAREALIAAVDCTGHGVPGAFMSMIGNNALNQTVVENMITEPDQILNEINNNIINILGSDNSGGGSRDGMDMAICKINMSTLKLEFAGANRPLYHIRKNQLNIIDAVKHPIGDYENKNLKFENNTLQLQKDDIIYIFSDGYPDQFGGKDNKKFLIRRFKELLMSIHQLDMQAQKRELKNTIDKWQGEYDQIDDMLVIGIKI